MIANCNTMPVWTLKAFDAQCVKLPSVGLVNQPMRGNEPMQAEDGFVDSRTPLEMAIHWQEAAAYETRCERINRDSRWQFLCREQQKQAAILYRLAREAMGLKKADQETSQ